jgi:hypothetical protein
MRECGTFSRRYPLSRSRAEFGPEAALGLINSWRGQSDAA